MSLRAERSGATQSGPSKLPGRKQLGIIPLLSLLIITPGITATQTPAVVEPISVTALASATPAPASTRFLGAIKPTLLIAQQESRTRRIQFAKGKTSAVVQDAVVRGTRDIYLVSAKVRQTMTVNITSIEKNAIFDISAPPGANGKRQTLRQEATSFSGVLPHTGDYQIVVGGTRGNASYRLEVTIK